MRTKTTLQVPHKHYYYHKRVLLRAGTNIFMIFVAFNEINKHKAKYMMIVRMPKILFFILKILKIRT